MVSSFAGDFFFCAHGCGLFLFVMFLFAHYMYMILTYFEHINIMELRGDLNEYCIIKESEFYV